MTTNPAPNCTLNFKNTMSKFLLTSFSILALLVLTIFILYPHPKSLQNYSATHKKLHIHKHVQIAESTCQGTLYTDLCVSTVAAFPELHRKTLPEIISATVNVTMKELRVSTANCSNIRRKLSKKLDQLELQALDDCLELFSDTVSELNKILADLTSTELAEKHYNDLQTLLSGARTNQFTCLDGFSHSKNNTRKLIEGRLRRITRHFSNSLAMVIKLKNRKPKKPNLRSIEEIFPEYGSLTNDFPTWLKKSDRRLLQLPTNQTNFNLIVAQDGSGNFSTIGEALSVVPNNSNTRFVIYIKTGAYYEYLEVARKQTMIMLIGDGIGKTLIKGNRSVGEGWTTFRSSTVAVLGTGFVAKGITFENFAGAANHQAVALRSGADFSAFYQCSFVAYQDTLYVHSLRQFYRECDVYGTVDFIFGNAAVVFQNSNLYARRPMANQRNIFTAQSREDPNENTGISILNCKVAAAADLIPVVADFRTYLGRPWRLYSRTVYMLSNLEGLVHPEGWLRWDTNSSVSLLYYGEYRNRGAGSNTSGRVTWPGYRVINDSAEASQFTAGNFIQAQEWLPETGITFFTNLTAA